MLNRRILIVDDDIASRAGIGRHLKAVGYYVIDAWSVKGASRLMSSLSFEGLIVCIDLDGGEGIEIVRAAVKSNQRVIGVSAPCNLLGKLSALEIGADDFMVKPLDPQEVVLRLDRALDRKGNGIRAAPIETSLDIDGRLALNIVDRCIVGYGLNPIALRRNDFELLRRMLACNGKVLRRDEIAYEIFGRRYLDSKRTIDVLVSDIRRKLEAAGSALKIKSVRGEGYMCVLDQKSRATSS